MEKAAVLQFVEENGGWEEGLLDMPDTELGIADLCSALQKHCRAGFEFDWVDCDLCGCVQLLLCNEEHGRQCAWDADWLSGNVPLEGDVFCPKCAQNFYRCDKCGQYGEVHDIPYNDDEYRCDECLEWCAVTMQSLVRGYLCRKGFKSPPPRKRRKLEA